MANFRVWDVKSGESIVESIDTEEFTRYMEGVCYSPDAKMIATGGKWLKIWDANTGELLKKFHLDGKFLVTGCYDNDLYIWDVSAIVKEAGLLSDIVDATPQPASKLKGAPRIPPGFFDDAQREANLPTQSHEPHNHATPVPRQRALSRFFSFLRRFKPHRETVPDTQSRSHFLSWTRNLVSGIPRRRDGSDIQLQEVRVPHTWAKPRYYHATGKKASSSSRPPNTRTTQQTNVATQSMLPSSPQPSPTVTASTPPAIAGTLGTIGAPSYPHVAIAGWRARFVGWLCFVPVQNINSQP
ncbi:uncharacterized protein BJ212DRAFT_1576922 [Suillus subaureus]|uniref:Anaphase-promoting complex subunit 4 WD40 domain-containing protein n=1 Tax=Suillus subaureus TaxID=48587 RepID=A0A9P7EBJ3_9AGAM|nr:uncharacterized protein BJ212DRAFT_1576922 [Suillus subaureus]KAG1816731.1 hypothetical protein BJ212DRAFT_1576922 [Suillus subaureus]